MDKIRHYLCFTFDPDVTLKSKLGLQMITQMSDSMEQTLSLSNQHVLCARTCHRLCCQVHVQMITHCCGLITALQVSIQLKANGVESQHLPLKSVSLSRFCTVHSACTHICNVNVSIVRIVFPAITVSCPVITV